ncbi:MAG TPA: family 20 glycosylhydrolase [Chitinophagaceae bacterium]|nr:family 20 glycosylhydrolase [Chitinophagaceae bacterium]
MIKATHLFFLLFFVAAAVPAQQQLSVIPRPVSVAFSTGSFILDENTSIRFRPSPGLSSAAVFLNAAIKNISGYDLKFNKSTDKVIELAIGNNLPVGKEGYQLNVSPGTIAINANNREGIIYGIQTLLQTLPAIRTNARLEISCMRITDYPRFAYRGMHLDVSRHFFGPAFIKEYIDLLAAYKMNVFHWHLVDDQGWRIEIKKYPQLTAIGGWRVDHTDKIWGNRPQARPGEKAGYGGFYTQVQIKEIVAYAAVRNITIIPEIEMPGHVAAAIAAYPALSCTQQMQLPLTGGNYTGMSSNYCAGNDSVFLFLENVLKEVTGLFPSAYIHIGGDEVDKSPWKKCSRCQQRIKKEGLKNEEELQSYFIRRIEKFLKSRNRKIIGWDEILEGGLAPEATVMSWRGEKGGVEAARQQHTVIMTPGKPVYFDHYQAGPEGEPLAIGGMNTLKNVYDYEPVPQELSKEEAKYVLGAQANLWTEFITTAEQAEYMLLPRMPALAEVLWSRKEDKDWDSFTERLQKHVRAYEQKGIRYCPGNYTVAIRPLSQNGKLEVQLATEIPHAVIYYTTDGTEPSLNSTPYSSPVRISSSVLLKAAVAVNGRIMGVQAAKQQFILHKALARPVDYVNPVSRYYMADGPHSLTDGIRGGTAIGKYWHGFSAKDLIATIDLGELQTIRYITLGCLQNYNDWIFLPQEVKFEISVNGTDFEEVQVLVNPHSIHEKNLLYDFKASFAGKPARFIRVTARNNLCPAGHSGAGKPGWIFADEIIVE